jgi:cell wall-associated NlpC family hydrolase
MNKILNNHLLKVIFGIFILLISIVLIVTIYKNSREDVFADSERWVVTIGGKDIVALSSEENAKAVIDGIKKSYLTENSEVVSVELEPAMAVSYRSGQEDEETLNILPVVDAIEYILLGTKEPKTYKVKKGDSLWDIAVKNGFTLDELLDMNKGKNLEMIHIGDIINLYEVKPFVTVTTTEVITSTKAVKFDIEYKKTSKLLKGMTEVKNEGEKGSKKVTAQVVKENGEIVDKDIQKEIVVKKPVTEVRLKGTKVIGSAEAGVTYKGSGSKIANYALQFVGNPYVYGGTSLTNGADCSGFVQSVYDHFGIPLCHDADVMRNYGVSVSLSEASPGDLVCYNGHVGIYIGGGKIVHAYNERAGITVSGVGIQQIVSVRRLLK